MNIWWLSRRIAAHRPRPFWVGFAGFVVFFIFPVPIGWVLGRGFRALAEGDTHLVLWMATALLALEGLRMATIHYTAIVWTQAWVHMQSLLRANMLAAQMVSGGPLAGRPVASAGEAITHFRDDVEDVTMFIDGLVDLTAGVVFTTGAGFVLGALDPRAALVLLLPLGAVALMTRTMESRIKRYRGADRTAAMAVSGLLGDVMAAATTVKVNDAVDPVMTRLRGLVDARRRTAVRDRVLDEGIWAFSQGAADVGLGLVVLVSAAAIASGSFSIGELAVFTAYLGWLSFLPRMIGRSIARRKQVEVAFGRMRRLVADEDERRAVDRRELPIGPGDSRARPQPARPPRVPLRTMEVCGLDAVYPGGSGVHDVNFAIERGSFTVITGEIGAGKTTLLRALLGLAHDTQVSGMVLWNGVPIGDRAAFLVPPNAGYLPQVPQLISDSLADNVSLGPADQAALARALTLAEVRVDIEEMPDGPATLIGPRGLRLSGGQRQRVATARALVHAPELVVLDDLSSALDVETELALWTNLAGAGMTVIAVSHRAVALARADQILRLHEGLLVGG